MADELTRATGGHVSSPDLALGDCDFVPLPDLSGQSVTEILGDTNLAQAIKRLVEGLDDPDGVISAFASFAGGAMDGS